MNKKAHKDTGARGRQVLVETRRERDHREVHVYSYCSSVISAVICSDR